MAVAVAAVVAVVGELEVETGGHLEARGVVEAKAKAVARKVVAEEAGMVAVEEAADTAAHHGHIVAGGGVEVEVEVAEKLEQGQQSKMLLHDKEMILRVSRRKRQQERYSLASHA